MLTRLIPNLKKTGSDEWTGPCFVCGGDDRLVVNMRNGGEGGLYWCRKCKASGDSITFLREHGKSYQEACDELGIIASTDDRVSRGSYFRRLQESKQVPRRFKQSQQPPELWMKRAASFSSYAVTQLPDSPGQSYMEGRGISVATMDLCGIGYNHRHWKVSGDDWGCPDIDLIHIAEGVVIPWVIDGLVVRVNVRVLEGDKRYRHIKGGRGGMFIAHEFKPMRDTIVCEGEIDAMSLIEIGLDANCVATGSAQGSRDAKSVARLASSGRLFVALDPDEAGEEGWKYWHKTFRNAVRISPPEGMDINSMLTDNTLGEWINEQVTER